MTPDTIYGWPNINSPFQLCQTERCAMVLISDSNGIRNGDGWDDAWAYALGTRFGLFGGGLLSANENAGNGAGTGYFYGAQADNTVAVSGANAALDAYLNKGTGALGPHNYGFVPDGSSVVSTSQFGRISVDCSYWPLTSKAALWTLHYGTFTTGTGNFWALVRGLTTGFVVTRYDWNHDIAAPLPTNTGAFSIQRETIDSAAFPAGTATVECGFSMNGQIPITGPFFGLWLEFELPSVTTGWAVHTLNAHASVGTRVAATDIIQLSNTALTYYLQEVRRPLGPSQSVTILINEGVNDRNDAAGTSVGPNPTTPGNTSAAFNDNQQAIINRISAIYDLSGWSKAHLQFVVMPSHVIATPTDDASLLNYRNGLPTLVAANSKSGGIRLDRLMTYEEAVAGHWYDGPADGGHMLQAGYRTMALRVLDALISGPPTSPRSGRLRIGRVPGVHFGRGLNIGSGAGVSF